MHKSASCPNSLECARLYTALELMAKAATQGSDPVVKAMHRSFLLKIGVYGYDVPDAKHRCRSAVRRETIRGLISEAADILRCMHRRLRGHRRPDAVTGSALRLERVA